MREKPHLLYIDTSVLLENTPLVKFIRNHIRDSSGIFSISSLDIDDFTVSIRWCMIETSSGLPRKSSAIFGHFRRMLGNVRVTFGVLETLRKSSESGRKYLRKIVKNAVISVSI